MLQKLRNPRQWYLALPLLLCFAATTNAIADDQRVIIKCKGSCDTAVAAVLELGGQLNYQYKYVNAIAVSVPSDKRGDVIGIAGADEIYKDLMVGDPAPVDAVSVAAGQDVQVLDAVAFAGLMEDTPADYLFNNDLIGASTLHAGGNFGDGVIVGIIDTGTANQSAFDRSGCPTPGPSVIGGETFIGSAGPSEPSATSFANGAHGTWVGTTIAANAGFLFSSIGTLAQSVAIHAPGSAIVLDPPNDFLTVIPMVGVAPCAQIYALKTFLSSGGGAPTSDIVAAMERAIELKENYNAGVPSVSVSGSGDPEDPFVYDSLNIEVVNMSLGGPTLFAGNDLDDVLTEKMLEVGITVVNSAGNEGHAAMTGGSAGTGRGSITVAAASTAAHERIFHDVFTFGVPGLGSLYRPFGGTQTATFSSRGPSADGRISTNITSNGFAVFAQNAAGGLNLVSGTSFSAPTVAGAAALLHAAEPDASAVGVRNALVSGADITVLADNSGPFEQGNGFLDIPAALDVLQNGVGDAIDSGTESASVKGNIASVGVPSITLGRKGYATAVNDLLPGQVAHFFVDVKKGTDAMLITLDDIAPELPPAEQNAFFGDDIYLKVQDAVTSDEATLVESFVSPPGNAFLVENPQEGILRVAVMGDWTNAGRISTGVRIQEARNPSEKKTAHDKVAQGALDLEEFSVPAGTSELVIELRWNNNWGKYPTDDLDLILITPSNALNFDGATLDSPERVVIENPEAGDWTAAVQGFTVWGVHGSSQSHWELRVTADGRSL